MFRAAIGKVVAMKNHQCSGRKEECSEGEQWDSLVGRIPVMINCCEVQGGGDQ